MLIFFANNLYCYTHPYEYWIPPTSCKMNTGTRQSAPLLRLPTEVLDDIYSCLVDLSMPEIGTPSEHIVCRIQGLAPVALVCQRLKETVTPSLYSSVVIDTKAMENGRSSARSLHRTLEQNPQLRTWCQKIRLAYNTPTTLEIFPLRTLSGYADDIRAYNKKLEIEGIVADLLTWAPSVKALDIEIWGDGRRTRLYPLIASAVRNMPLLSSVTIDGRFDLAQLAGSFSGLGPNASLKSVKVTDQHNNVQHRRGSPLVSYASYGPTSKRHIKLTSIKAQYRKAPFTELKLSEMVMSSELVDQFLRWPRRLQKLCIEIHPEDDDAMWDLGDLVPALRLHRDTLTSIKISVFLSPCIYQLAVSDFPNLTRLHIGVCDGLIEGDYDLGLLANLIAPRLEFFSLSTEYIDHSIDGDLPDDFVPPEVPWLRALVDAAVARGPVLEGIHVSIHVAPCEVDPDPTGHDLLCEHLNIMARDFLHHGIWLSYENW